MSRIDWGVPGTRLFEIGVDRGVVYHGEYPGEPWSGISSIDEDSKTDIKSTYLDGLKVFQIATVPEYNAKITSYSEPAILRRCVGDLTLSSGLTLTNQKIKSFDLTYRTRVGNDLIGSDYGYKLHLVYNAMSEPPSKQYETLSKSDDVMKKSWEISTVPVPNSVGVPTAHMTLDSRLTDPTKLTEVEAYLYGSNTSEPMMLSVSAIFELLGIDKSDESGDSNDETTS